MGVHVKEFSIQLQGKRQDAYGFKIFRVGEKLTGLIVISGQIQNISGLKLILSGRARSYWKELTDDDDKQLKFHDEDKCVYVHVDLDIENSIVKKKEYSFEFSLPVGLPSSFDGLYGDIIYSLTAVLEIDAGAISRSVQKEFKLEGYLNLKEHAEVLEPIEIEVTKHMLFGVGHLGLYAKLNKSGFLPGEMVHFDMKFTNECDSQIQVNLFLLRETIYHAGENKITHTEILDTVQGPVVKPHAKQELKGGLVKIPLDCTTVLSNCKIMEMQYRFLIEMNIPGPHMNLEGTIPIIIGTVSNDKPLAPEPEEPTETPAIEDKPVPVPEPGPTVPAADEPKPDVVPVPVAEEEEEEPEPTPWPTPEKPDAVPVPGPEEEEPEPTTWPAPEKPIDKKPVRTGSSKFRARHQRAHTTTNVFRPKPVRQILPTPKPEMWSRPIEIPAPNDYALEKEEEKPVQKPKAQDREPNPKEPEQKPKLRPQEQERQQIEQTPTQQQEQITEQVLEESEDEQQQQKQEQEQGPHFVDDSAKYTGIIKPKPKKSLPYPKFVDSPLFPKPVKKCLVNVFLVAENKILEPIGWRIKKSKCCLERVGGCCCHCRGLDMEEQKKAHVLARPSVGWSKE